MKENTERENKPKLKRTKQYAAFFLGCFLGTGCDVAQVDPRQEAARQPESVVGTPTVQPVPTKEFQFLPDNLQDQETERQPIVLFNGDPRNSEGFGAEGKGFSSECSFGDQPCAPWQKVLSGPFLREFDQEDVVDDATYEVTIQGSGTLKIGATDWKMTEDLFGFGGQDVNLDEYPNGYTFQFYWPGLTESDNGYTGYGFEIIAQAPDGVGENPVTVDDVKISVVGQGDLTQ